MIKTYHKHSIGKLNMRSISRMFFANFKKRKILIFSLIALIIILPISLIVFYNKSSVEAAWMNDQWGYRQTVAITNAGTAQTDFQVAITLNTSALITAGKMQSDCDDIRITDLSGKILPYWLSGCNTTTTKIWPKVPSLPTTGATVYLYYGNLSAAAGKTKVGTQTYPGLSCKSVLDAGDSSGTGNYWIDPTNGNTSDAFQAYCDQTNDSGGWMLVTQSMIQSEVNSNTSNVKTVDTNGGLVNIITIGGTPGCSGKSYQILLKDTVPWTKIRADYEFYGGNSCWGVFGNGAQGPGSNLISYQAGTDTIRNQVKMGGSNGNNFDGITSRCDNETINFWHSNQGNVTRSAQTILRRNSMSSYAGLSNGVACTGYTDGWKYQNIYTREDSMELSNITVASPTNEQKSPAPVAYWKFDEGNGVTANNSFWQKTGTTTNMELNPSLETNMNGWSGWNNSGTATRELSTEKAAFGSYSFKQTVTATGSQEGDSYGASIQEGRTYTVSFWVNAPILGPGESIPFYYRIFHDTGNYIPGTIATINAVTNGWVRYSMTQTIPVNGYTGTNIQLSFYTNSIGTVIYVDGVQIEESSSATSYCDGSLTGNGSHIWNGTAHASSSTCETGSDADLRGTSWASEDQCISGKCQYFNGINSYILTPHKDGNLMFKSGDFSVNIWAKPTSMTGYSGLITTDIAGDSAWKIFRDSGNSFFSARYGTNTLNFPVVNINEWHQYGYVKSGTTLTLYLDGKQVNQGSVPATHSVDGTELAFGSYRINDAKNGNYIFKGFMDEIKIYPYARSAAQIKSDFASKGSGSIKGTSVQMGSNTKNSDAFSNGLVGYWKMDESSWGSVIDASGNGNTGTAFGNATITAGKFGNGGTFDNTGDGVSIGSPASLDFGNNGPFTFAGWVKPTTLGDYDGFVSKDTASRTSPYSYMTVFMANGRLSAYNNSAWIDICPAGSIVTGNWQYVVFDYNGTNLTGYVNGVACGSAAFTYPDNAAYEVAIGSWYSPSPGSYDYNGAMDDVRIYNRALSPKEVRDLYAFAPGPLLYWKFDEKSGSAQDSSGNNYIGTITGSPTQGIVGKFGSAFTFTSGQTRVGNTSVIPPSWNNFSIMGWIKPTPSDLDSNWHDILGWRYDQNGNVNGLWIFQNKLTFWSGTGGTSQYNQTLTAGNWYHVATTFDGTTRTVYLNGVAQTFTAGFTNTTNEFYVGTAGTSPVYPSYQTTDEVKIYPYVRTSKQITEDMNAGHPAGGSPVGSQIAYYKFDEGQGATANNSGSIGSSSNGTITGATWTNNGKYNKAISFSGVDQDVNILYTLVADVSDFTYTAWVKANNSGDNPQFILGQSMGGTNNNYCYSLLYNTSGSLSVSNNGAAPTILSYSYNLSNWTHVAVTHNYSQNSSALYIDGKKVKTDIATSCSQAPSAQFKLGRGPWPGFNNDFNGLLDEVKIYNAALTADEIKLDYNRGSAMVLGDSTEQGLIKEGLILNLDSTNTSSYPGSGTTWYDISGSSNDFTIEGAPQFDAGQGFGDFGSGKRIYRNSFPQNLKTSQGGQGYTALIWAKSTGGQGAWRKPLGNNDGENYIDLYQNSGAPYAYTTEAGETLFVDGVQYANNTYVVPNSGWHLWGATNLNGGGTSNPVGALTIGNEPNGTSYPWIGKIAIVRLYNRVLAPGDMKQIYDLEAGKFGLSSTGPVAEWNFEEGSGTNANDTSGNGYTGSITNPLWTNGKVGKALNFTGSSNVAIGAGKFDSLTNATVELWIKYTGTFDTNRVFFYRTKDGSNRMPVFVSFSGGYGNKIAYENIVGGANRAVTSDTTISANTWYHLALTCGTGGMKMYINGTQQSSTNATTDCFSAINATTSTDFGSSSFIGNIDQPKIFNYVRTPAQIAYDYNRGGPIGWWKMDECQGITANDSSGNGNSGTITIGATIPQSSAGTCTDGLATSAWYNGRTGKYNASLNFDGVDDYVNAGQVLATDQTKPFTFAAWAKSTSGGMGTWRTIVGTNTSFAQIAFSSSNDIRFGQNGGGGWWQTGSSIIADTWYHVVGIYDGTNARLYVNGNLISGPTARTFTSAHGVTVMGRYQTGGGEWMNGQIDDVRIYNYSLTPVQIKTLYNGGAAIQFAPATGSP